MFNYVPNSHSKYRSIKMKINPYYFVPVLLAAWQCVADEPGTNVWGPITNNVKMAILVKPVSWTFSSDDISDLPAAIERLRQNSDPVSAFLWQKLTNPEQLLLMNYQRSATSSTQAQDIVLQAFNKIIEGPMIYNDERFRGMHLGPEAWRLIGEI